MAISKKFLSPYNSQESEQALYEKWENSGYFNPDNLVKDGIAEKDADTFSIVLPPPNVTGTLHIGSAMMLAVEDIMVRFARMQGKRTLWLPGTDHAAIATQSKVEKILTKQGKRRSEMGREAFLKEVEDFAQNSHDTIVNQMRRVGTSVDWSREAFTLDKPREKAVYTAFKQLYELGLIYRGDRIVNWDPKGQTVISDDEVEYEEEKSTFYYFQYGPFVIGTARPETKFGDKYVVMHPDDERYKDYAHGDTFECEWINGPIMATVIKDESIDMEMGTGVMTITPWHSEVDFEIAERHGLDKEQIIDKYGKLLPIAGEFEGIKIAEARDKIVEKLNKKGLLVKKNEQYTHRVALAQRSGGKIEPQIMRQWFIDVNKTFPLPHSEIDGIESGQDVTLKKLMLHVVKTKQIQILPKRFEKVYFHWIENLHDWCISRQIWYGHRIPVWYKGDETYVGTTPPEGDGWDQDEDTLDTWFSSGLWTFSTLGWPDKTDDMKAFHPTSVIESGYDILFFWIARMILMSTTLVGQIPFETVYLHGLVRDEKGRKMSKSLDNIIDPVDMIEKYGADAVRMSLIIGTGPGNDSKMSENKIKAYKHFANKMWNITRFVLENTENMNTDVSLTSGDAHIWSEFTDIKNKVTTDLERYKFYLAGEALYDYAWHTFADEILENSKDILSSDDESAKASRQKLLMDILTDLIKMLHPFMPYVTEAIWQEASDRFDTDLLIVTKWPKV